MQVMPKALTARLICNKSQLRCTSIAVIHQPRWKTLTCFDQVVLLAAGGYLVYSGPVPDSVAYFTQSLNMEVSEGDNPADLFLDFIGAEDPSLYACCNELSAPEFETASISKRIHALNSYAADKERKMPCSWTAVGTMLPSCLIFT